MDFGNIIFAAICCLCSLIFGVIALWAFKRKDPMHFWSGTTVRPEEITDIPSYNRANGLMWTIYTICMVITGVFSLFSILTGAILLIILCIPGTVVLIVAYNRIYNKYKSTSFIYRTDELTAKTPKAVIIAIISITAIIVISLVPLFYYGEKDPDISILDNQIQIKAMYGLNVDFSEISKISLIEKSMSEIGTVKKTNGYDGIGGTLKGNFKADHLGEILLFVKSKSAPTIKIERTNKEAVYISLRNSGNTEQLYQDLIKKYH
ncbi:hypothetical protein [Clostridium sp. YIM B02555]|uniref:hypothetical protein n=1 Tax=Clostridium sp. YIM B02555 TaxID=2911968 RepID=UPI001EEE4F94|nr:hypothetical protein [Clostridium sp. YIM B02555]